MALKRRVPKPKRNKKYLYQQGQSGSRAGSVYTSQVPKKARDSQDQYDSNRVLAKQERKEYKGPPKDFNKLEASFYEKAMRKRQKELSSKTPITDSDRSVDKINKDLAKSSKAAEADDRRILGPKYRRPVEDRINRSGDRYNTPGFYKSGSSNKNNKIHDGVYRPSKDGPSRTAERPVYRPGNDKPASFAKSVNRSSSKNEIAQAKRDLAVKRLRGKRPIKPGER